MLKILQDRLKKYVNHEPPYVQAGCRKGRGTRDQIANIRWIMEKGREFKKKKKKKERKKTNKELLEIKNVCC